MGDMRLLGIIKNAAGTSAVLAILAGCSSSGTTPAAPAPSTGGGGSQPGAALDFVRSQRGRGIGPTVIAHHNAKALPNVYVADSGNNAVYEILYAGGFTQMLTLGSGFSSPTGVAVDKKGDVFVADHGNNAIKEMIAVDGGIPKNPVIQTLTTSISGPYGIALDRHNNVFVTNNADSSVYELVAPNYSSINTYGSFTYPTSVATDSAANVYVGTAAGSSEVFEMLAPGYTTIEALGGGYGEFLNPYGLAVDRHGDVFVADYNYSAVQMMPPSCFSTSCVTTLTSQFYRPLGMAVDKVGNVYGDDAASGEVFQIVKAGGYHTINPLGSGFVTPWGIAVH